MSSTPQQLLQETLELCRAIATYSTHDSTVKRFCLTPQMEQLHAYLKQYFSSSLQTQTDKVGNIIFTPLKKKDHSVPRKRVLIGSHLDTVSGAGHYDGILGVVIGLLCAREYSGEQTEFNAVGFADEEGGRFGCRFLGSLNFIGRLPPEYLTCEDNEGISLSQARHLYKQDDFSAYLNEDSETIFLELHTEQGLRLHQANQSIGIVNEICGQAVITLIFKGRSAHAVSKWARQDTLVAACDLVSLARKIAMYDSNLHITFGYLSNAPNQSNVVSDHTTVKVDVRHVKDDIRQQVLQQIIDCAQGIATLNSVRLEHQIDERKTAPMDMSLVQKLTQICQHNHIDHRIMPSYAGHDALIMTRVMPTGLIFLRDDKGISHHPHESVDHQAIKDAFSILLNY